MMRSAGAPGASAAAISRSNQAAKRQFGQVKLEDIPGGKAFLDAVPNLKPIKPRCAHLR